MEGVVESDSLEAVTIDSNYPSNCHPHLMLIVELDSQELLTVIGNCSNHVLRRESDCVDRLAQIGSS